MEQQVRLTHLQTLPVICGPAAGLAGLSASMRALTISTKDASGTVTGCISAPNPERICCFADWKWARPRTYTTQKGSAVLIDEEAGIEIRAAEFFWSNLVGQAAVPRPSASSPLGNKSESVVRDAVAAAGMLALLAGGEAELSVMRGTQADLSLRSTYGIGDWASG